MGTIPYMNLPPSDSPQRFEEVPFRDYLRRVREIESGGECITRIENIPHGWRLTIVPEARFDRPTNDANDGTNRGKL